MSNTVSFYTLGCKLNFSETSTIGRQLADAGFQKKNFNEGADLYVINTCSVTDHADRKCKKIVKEALRYNPNAYVVIVGCYAQLKPEEISNIPGVDMVLGAAEKFNLIHHLQHLTKEVKAVVHNKKIKETNEFVPGFSLGDRTRAFLKVQDGCDYFCTFCTIPLARGKSRSHSIQETMETIEKLRDTEVKEIVLTGVNLGDFGITNGENFYGLLCEIEKLDFIERVRISSIEPNLLSDEIIELVSKSEKVMPHFHIPLQSGSDEILTRMRRKYLRNLYVEKVAKIKALIPHCCIGVDVIVGFPGETEEHFLETYNFLNELDISYLHVFPYSERSNTTAAKMKEVVPHSVRTKRSEMLRILSEKKKRFFYNEHLNSDQYVLFEEKEKNGELFGFSQNYIKIKVPYDPMLVNEIVPVHLNTVSHDGVVTGETLENVSI
jgi:threonylcarbamoyladenosine tRNA methylthiotransferase MtaB